MIGPEDVWIDFVKRSCPTARTRIITNPEERCVGGYAHERLDGVLSSESSLSGIQARDQDL